MTPHLPTHLMRCANSGHLLPDSMPLPPLFLLHMHGPLRRVATGVRAPQQVLEMPVGVNGESGVIALLDYGNNGMRAKMCNKGL